MIHALFIGFAVAYICVVIKQVSPNPSGLVTGCMMLIGGFSQFVTAALYLVAACDFGSVASDQGCQGLGIGGFLFMSCVGSCCFMGPLAYMRFGGQGRTDDDNDEELLIKEERVVV